MQDDLDNARAGRQSCIIHNGPGSADTIRLIDKYARSEQTLILV